MGKWDHVTKDLPAELPADTPFQDKVNDLKKHFRGQTSAHLIKKFAELKKAKSELDEKREELNAQIAAVEQIIWSNFEEEGVSKLKVAGVGSFSVGKDPYASVTDKDAFRAWAMANGYERYLTIYSQTVNSITKELLESGDALPEGIQLSVRTKTYFRKS